MGVVLKKRKRMKSLARNTYTAQIITLLGNAGNELEVYNNIGINSSGGLSTKVLALKVKLHHCYWYYMER